MPPKGKPDTAGYQRFKKELAAGTPGKLYLLHGEEDLSSGTTTWGSCGPCCSPEGWGDLQSP